MKNTGYLRVKRIDTVLQRLLENKYTCKEEKEYYLNLIIDNVLSKSNPQFEYEALLNKNIPLEYRVFFKNKILNYYLKYNDLVSSLYLIINWITDLLSEEEIDVIKNDILNDEYKLRCFIFNRDFKNNNIYINISYLKKAIDVTNTIAIKRYFEINTDGELFSKFVYESGNLPYEEMMFIYKIIDFKSFLNTINNLMFNNKTVSMRDKKTILSKLFIILNDSDFNALIMWCVENSLYIICDIYDNMKNENSLYNIRLNEIVKQRIESFVIINKLNS